MSSRWRVATGGRSTARSFATFSSGCTSGHGPTEQGNAANWAFVWGDNCPFTEDCPAACGQVAWAFVDYADAALRDFWIFCWFDDGIRPPGETSEDICATHPPPTRNGRKSSRARSSS